jgi:hypothetical protein
MARRSRGVVVHAASVANARKLAKSLSVPLANARTAPSVRSGLNEPSALKAVAAEVATNVAIATKKPESAPKNSAKNAWQRTRNC